MGQAFQMEMHETRRELIKKIHSSGVVTYLYMEVMVKVPGRAKTVKKY